VNIQEETEYLDKFCAAEEKIKKELQELGEKWSDGKGMVVMNIQRSNQNEKLLADLNDIQKKKQQIGERLSGMEDKNEKNIGIKKSDKFEVNDKIANTWDKVTNERILTLDPRVQGPATEFINRVEKELGIQLRITTAYRSFEEQDKLYWQDKTNPPTGPWATDAKGGESYHNYGLGMDIVIMKNGECIWDIVGENIVKISKELGFEWGGNWKRKKDYPHFEMSFGTSTKKLYKKYLENFKK